MNKLIVILGPTASGKSDLAVKLAKKFGGEIISADSRQVYKGLDIGSGKITKRQMRGIPHHLLDVASPKRKFTVAHFQKMALQKIKEIQRRGRVPFLVGGTGFYIQSVIDNIAIPEVKPNWALRKKLEKMSVAELFLMLKKLDPARAKTIDPKNPRRLIRAIEIIEETGKPIPKTFQYYMEYWNVLQIGIKKSPGELKKAIQKRLYKRLKGMILEVKNLHRQGLSWKRLEELGLEYRYTAQYLQGKFNNPKISNKIHPVKYRKAVISPKAKLFDRVKIESEHFAKRQMTWFKRHPAPEQVRYGASKRIHWIENPKEAEKLIKTFL
ncbi:MAG: tRNA (adenosine(37)-N6)-dimethylallyltransferase MiaA [Patescibacteria group bacterium]